MVGTPEPTPPSADTPADGAGAASAGATPTPQLSADEAKTLARTKITAAIDVLQENSAHLSLRHVRRIIAELPIAWLVSTALLLLSILGSTFAAGKFAQQYVIAPHDSSTVKASVPNRIRAVSLDRDSASYADRNGTTLERALWRELSQGGAPRASAIVRFHSLPFDEDTMPFTVKVIPNGCTIVASYWLRVHRIQGTARDSIEILTGEALGPALLLHVPASEKGDYLATVVAVGGFNNNSAIADLFRLEVQS